MIAKKVFHSKVQEVLAGKFERAWHIVDQSDLKYLESLPLKIEIILGDMQYFEKHEILITKLSFISRIKKVIKRVMRR